MNNNNNNNSGFILAFASICNTIQYDTTLQPKRRKKEKKVYSSISNLDFIYNEINLEN